MNRQQYDEKLKTFGAANNTHTSICDAEIIQETKKAIQVEVDNGVYNRKRLWFPKSVLAHQKTKIFGNVLCVKKWFLSKNSLWWLTR